MCTLFIYLPYVFGLKKKHIDFIQILLPYGLKQNPDSSTEPDPSTEPEMADTSALDLLETIKVLSGRHDPLFTKLSISQLSGCIGIASSELEPILSIMYPGTDTPPLILSRDDQIMSTLFVTISDKEYLAASFKNSIRLWNPATNTSSVVYQFKEEKDWLLCVIDERTIACVAKESLSDRLSKIYILNTDSEKFTLSGMLQVKAGLEITDICYVKTSDGTSCLILSFPSNKLIKRIEIVGGRVRWQVDQQQMGESFLPWSICTDGSTVFVADPLSVVLHLLSVQDGLVLMSIRLHQYPSCVRLHGEHLYIGHENRDGKYCISKFTKPVAI